MLRNSRNEKISQKKEKHPIIKTEKKPNITVIEKLIILNIITDKNNNNYNNISKELYR